MQRTVSAHLDLRLDGPTDMVFSLAVARGSYEIDDSFVLTRDGEPLEVHEVDGPHGARLHRASSEAGRVVLDYRATVTGRSEPDVPSELDLVEYLRPSRFCEADVLTPLARAEFAGLEGVEAVTAVREWVHNRLRYVPWSSDGLGGAVQTLENNQGVCRDFAHTVVALLRALDIPARVAAVYAPELQPPDFHAVSEAWIEGAWHVVDATGLAPRGSLLRMSAGRDTADTAFLSSYGTDLELITIGVRASVDEVPDDDGVQLVQLG